MTKSKLIAMTCAKSWQLHKWWSEYVILHTRGDRAGLKHHWTKYPFKK